MREYDINLIPDDILRREALMQRMKSWVFLAAGVVLFLIALNLGIKIMNNHALKKITALESAGEMVSGKMIQENEVQARELELLKLKDTVGHLSKHSPVMAVFASVDRAINYNTVLTHLEFSSQFPALQKSGKGAAGSGSYFSNTAPVRVSGGNDNMLIMRGMSLSNSDLAVMLAKLSDNNIYSSVNLKYSRSGDLEDGMPISFEIECMLNDMIYVSQ
ncbi:MAG: hypothetical protein IT393_02530 [Nitrospirae bacterium]|nr:hypothetical protein [Nitrospirota bacterium]